MSPPYRIERELTVAGQPETFRVIVRLGKDFWGKVQTGMTKEDADELLRVLLAYQEKKRTQWGIVSRGYRR
jgi:hypothetical protein